jgi:hypothetical protein
LSPTEPWIRDWHPWDDYRSVHDSHLRHHHFIANDRLTWVEIPDEAGALRSIILAGEIECLDGVTVQIRKSLEVQPDLHGRPLVRGDRYSYQAYWPGDRGILRYDNANSDTPEEFHRHEYDLATGEEKLRTILSRAEMPRLSEFLDEVAELVGFGQ